MCCSYSCTDTALGELFVLQCAVHTVVQTLHWGNCLFYSVLFIQLYRHCTGGIFCCTVCCSYSCTDTVLGELFVLQCAVHTVVRTVYWGNCLFYSVLFIQLYRHCIGRIVCSTVCCSYSCTDTVLWEMKNKYIHKQQNQQDKTVFSYIKQIKNKE